MKTIPRFGELYKKVLDEVGNWQQANPNKADDMNHLDRMSEELNDLGTPDSIKKIFAK